MNAHMPIFFPQAAPMLTTRRLDLVPCTLEHLRAELGDPSDLEALLGAQVPESWPPGEYDHDAIAYFHSRLEAEGPESIGWYVWYAITRDESGQRGRLVAAAGFFGPPSGDSVEIGYSVIPEARGQGFASEIVAALVERAFQTDAVNQVIAHTTDANPASIAVLLRCGFERTDADDVPDSVRYRRYRSR